MMVFGCSASMAFAEKVVEHLKDIGELSDENIHLGELEVVHFKDKEFQPYFLESVRGATVYLIQSTVPPSDNLMELLLCIDAAKRASASKIIVVTPYFGWARQDRKAQLTMAATHHGLLAMFFRWPYHANVIKQFEQTRRKMVR